MPSFLSVRPCRLLCVVLVGIVVGSVCVAISAPDKTDPFKPPAITTRSVPVVPERLTDRLRQYQNIRSADFEGWAPDGNGILIRTRFGNTSQLHRVYQPMGYREQITFFDEPVSGRFLRDDKDGDLLLTMSAGGNEQYQIFYFDRSTGKAVRLTDGTSRNRLGPVLHDGSRMIVASNKRNGRDTDLYIAETRKPGSMKMILKTDGEYWSPVDWSRDRFTLLINHYVSINETYPALLDIVTGKKTPIPLPKRGGNDADDAEEKDANTTDNGKTGKNNKGKADRKSPASDSRKVAFGAMAFAPDGKSIYAATDAAGEFRHLARISLKDFQYTWITRDIPWDVTDIEVAPPEANRDGGLVAFTVNENGASSLYFLAHVEDNARKTLFPRGDSILLQRDQPVRYEMPLGVIGSLKFSPDGKRLGFTLSRPDAPADVYSIDLQTGKLTRWTNSEVGGLDTSAFIRPEQILYPTFDRISVPDPDNPNQQKRIPRRIPAYYFRPEGATEAKPAPVLINIHGGPESQYRPYLSSVDQFLLNELGIAVIRPNVRGSAGYGKTYLQLDNARLREDSVRDIGKLLEWVEQRPELDENRIAVIGGSYGGYMVLGSLMHFGDKIRAGVDIVGIASFATFLKNTSDYRRDLRRAEYGDERTPEMKAFFARIDPVNNAHKIKSALYVAHGKNDPRVPFSEAVQIADKVRDAGKTVWTVYAENEGHGFRKKANRDYLYATVVLFLQKHLLQ